MVCSFFISLSGLIIILVADFIKKASLTNPQIVGLDQPKDQAEYEDVSNHSFTNTLMLNKAEKPLNTQGCCSLQPAGLGIS